MSTPVGETQNGALAPRSGQVYTDAQGLVLYSDQSDFENLLSQLRAHMEKAITDDHAEADIARSCIPRTWYCTDGYDATGTDRLFGDKEEQARAMFAALSETTAPIAKTAGAVKPNMEEAFTQWKEIATELDIAEADTRGLVHISGWSGQAADAYAANTRRKANEIKAMATLAHATKASVEAVSIMQTAIANAAADALQKAIEAVLRIKTDLHFDPAGAKKTFSQMSKNELLGYYFYERTRHVAQFLRRAKVGVESTLWDSQAWKDVSRATNDQLTAAAKEAQHWGSAQTNYKNDVSVTTWKYVPSDSKSKDQHIKEGW